MLYDASKSVATCVLILIPPAYITLVLRCGVRIHRKAWGVDDTCMIISAPFFAWLSASVLTGALNGLGAKDNHLFGGQDQYTTVLKNYFMFMLSYCCGVFFLKLSIALTLMRITAGRPAYIWTIRVTILVFTATIFMVFFYVLVQCKPIEYSWDKSIPGGHCKDKRILTGLSFGISAGNIVTDWTCALLPIPLLWNLEMHRNSKIAAGVLLSFGIFASICALIRLKYTIALNEDVDFLYHASFVVMWAYAEAGVGFSAANCSTLRPIFTRTFRLGSSRGKSDDTDSREYGCCPTALKSRRSGIELGDADASEAIIVHPATRAGYGVKTTVTAGGADPDDLLERERLGRGGAGGGSGGTAEDVGSFEDDASQREILREDRISTTYRKK
ncbi:hypothetical protein DBV05_g11920 [Lasiodiplodia theobromae]|uniref:Rhodopsin domain-containing protein n=1 Tax=Lasiodiplodia theobromae TaxID=45133 RepID=A0A5N5CVP4_9PEZI|nr:hypothetical protein DBV05_g11920 [Lasiodiplodia theobromae]